ncbi:hypothetical protein ACKFKF_34075 [Phormidesmis sp. 146-12]
MWSKAYMLALMIFGYTLAANLMLGLLQAVLGIKFLGMGVAIQFIAAYSIGQVYTFKQRQVISNSLKLWVSIDYTLIAICSTTVALLALKMVSPALPSSFLTLGILIPILVSPLIYWAIGSGSKAYLKKIKK